MSITVFGATGYIGSHLVSYLRQNGLQVNAIVRNSSNSKDVAFLESAGARLVRVGGNEPAILPPECQNNIAVQLVGSIAPKKGETLEGLHLIQTKRLIALAKTYNFQKIIMVTALGCDHDSKSIYQRTKRQAEEVLMASGVPYVIVRPSLIIGWQNGYRHSKLVKRYMELIKTRPFVPLIAGGESLVQPVFIGDLTKVLYKCITDDSVSGCFDIGGPEVLSMRQFVDKLQSRLGVKKLALPIPAPIAVSLALLCQTLQNTPLLSVDQVQLSQEDNICQQNALPSLLQGSGTTISGTTIEESLATYSLDNKHSISVNHAAGDPN
jgi:NADH dehydrogenase